MSGVVLRITLLAAHPTHAFIMKSNIGGHANRISDGWWVVLGSRSPEPTAYGKSLLFHVNDSEK